jgi:N-acetylglutamate synthase-like GNAT family acetyltransferase
MSGVTFRIANQSEYPRIEAAYIDWGYTGGVTPDDVIYVAERGEILVGIVRRTSEHGLTMLRGMYVAPAERRSGVGSQLLSVFVDDLRDTECYCVPYAHLQTFYGQSGFLTVAETAAPKFLRDRMHGYRQRGLDVCLMRRTS